MQFSEILCVCIHTYLDFMHIIGNYLLFLLWIKWYVSSCKIMMDDVRKPVSFSFLLKRFLLQARKYVTGREGKHLSFYFA